MGPVSLFSEARLLTSSSEVNDLRTRTYMDNFLQTQETYCVGLEHKSRERPRNDNKQNWKNNVHFHNKFQGSLRIC